MGSRLLPIVILHAALGFAADEASAQQVISENLVVQGNASVGTDADAAAVAGTDELVLKENNTRLAFLGSSPFRLTANDSANGGPNEFRIEVPTDPANGSDTATSYFVVPALGQSVTLGQGSTAASGTVSVGSTGTERRIAGLANPTGGNDLVPLGYIDERIVGPARTQASEIDALEYRTAAVTAMSAALSAIQSNPRATGPVSFGLGLGHFEDQTAGAAGVAIRASANLDLRVGVAFTGASSPQFNLSGHYQW